MNRLNCNYTAKPAPGISLIEVLVSLVILSLGVLAVVALQLVAKRNNADAGQRTIAAQLAYDVIERMRANANQASLSAYLTGSSPVGRVSRGASEPTNACTSASPCTLAQTVTHDLWEWEQTLDGASETVAGSGGVAGSNTGGLVSPTGCIEQTTDDGGGDGVYTITITWRGSVAIPDSNAGSAACGRAGQPSNSTQLYGASDEFRRSVNFPVYITARRT